MLKRYFPAPVKAAMRRAYHAIADLSFRPYVKRKNIEGVEFDFWIGDRDGRDWYDLQATDPVWPEMRFIKERLVSEGDVVFECGGHHGCTAVFLAGCVGPRGRVVTFEASPENCDIIEKNIALNKLANVRLERKAVGARAGTVRISSASNAAVDSSGRGREVPMVPLDAYAGESPTLLKIDVEGFEVEVLRGARSILATRPKLVLEVHTSELAGFGTSVDELFALIDAPSYRWWIQRDDVSTPEEFDLQSPLAERCHLFGLPFLKS